MPPSRSTSEESRGGANQWAALGAFPLGGWVLIACALILTGIGLTVLLSAGVTPDQRWGGYFGRQIVWLGLALCTGIVAFFFGIQRLRNYVFPLTFLSLLLLVLVLIPGIGVEVNGARRWIDINGFRFQPSEFGKLGFLLLFAWYVSLHARKMDQFWLGFILPSALFLPFAVLLILEPDLGTTVLYGVVAGGILLLTGTRFTYLFGALLSGCAALAVVIWHDPVRLQRITSFLNMEENRSEGGYQLWQSILGFGVGGLQGVGPGRGRQHLDFLPEAHTDFIFAVVGEELGFLATGSVVMLFVVFTFLVICQLRKAPDMFQFTFAIGALLFLSGQALINMGVVTGILPTKGMSLPFISYGGSNLVFVYGLTGLLLSTYRNWNQPILRKPREL